MHQRGIDPHVLRKMMLSLSKAVSRVLRLKVAVICTSEKYVFQQVKIDVNKEEMEGIVSSAGVLRGAAARHRVSPFAMANAERRIAANEFLICEIAKRFGFLGDKSSIVIRMFDLCTKEGYMQMDHANELYYKASVICGEDVMRTQDLLPKAVKLQPRKEPIKIRHFNPVRYKNSMRP